MDLPHQLASCLELAPYLQKVRERSLLACEDLEAALKELDLSPFPISCIFAVGSVGRLEISSRSDLDGVVVLRSASTEAMDVKTLMNELESVYANLGFLIAKQSGIYRTPVTRDELLDNQQRGSLNEQPSVYGKRIQMLLDARPLLNSDNYALLQEQVLNWFLPNMGEHTSYTFFINELQRYFHSYASWQMFKFARTEDDGWYLRQAKLRVTRVITVGAMMLLIGVSMHVGKKSILQQALDLTPIERLIFAFEFYGEHEHSVRLLQCYESALRVLLDEDARDELIRTSPKCIEEVGQTMPASYRKVYAASEEMMTLLTQFALDRRGEWPENFYRNWLF